MPVRLAANRIEQQAPSMAASRVLHRKILVFLGAVAVACLLWSVLGDAQGDDPPQPTIVPYSDYSTWRRELEDGSEVEFRKGDLNRTALATPTAQSKPDPANDVIGRDGKTVQTLGPLSPAQKSMASKRIEPFLIDAEDQYREQLTSAPHDEMKSLRLALDVLEARIALQMVQDDKTWVFASGQEDYHTAWRNVPRGWRKMSFGNVATTDDDRPIDLIIAINPEEHAEAQSILDQMVLAEESRVERLVSEFNALPLTTRQERMRKHLEAAAALRNTKQLTEQQRIEARTHLLDPAVRADTEHYLIYRR